MNTPDLIDAKTIAPIRKLAESWGWSHGGLDLYSDRANRDFGRAVMSVAVYTDREGVSVIHSVSLTTNEDGQEELAVGRMKVTPENDTVVVITGESGRIPALVLAEIHNKIESAPFEE